MKDLDKSNPAREERQVLSKEDWVYRAADGHYTATIKLPDDDIVIWDGDGDAKRQDIENVVQIFEEKVRSPLISGGYYMIQDFSRVKRASLGSRRFFAKWLPGEIDNIHAVYFFGMNPLTLLFVKLGRTFSPKFKDKVFIAKDFEEAVEFIHQHKAGKPDSAPQKYEPGEMAAREENKTTPESIPSLRQEIEALKTHRSERIEEIFAALARVTWDESFTPIKLDIPEDDPFADLFSAVQLLQEDMQEINQKDKSHSLESQESHKALINIMRAMEESQKNLKEEINQRKRADDKLRKLNVELEERVEARTEQLNASNKELEAFSYSISHDLRSPLRTIDGFSQVLLEDYHESLNKQGQDYLSRMRAGVQRMAQQIDNILKLSRVSRGEMKNEELDLTDLANKVVAELKIMEPERVVDVNIQSGLKDIGDPRLLQAVLDNLIGNAWKYTSKKKKASIEFGLKEANGKSVYFISDNGAGFDMAHSDKLFGTFQRLHTESEFPGTGIGLATVQRIIRRHGGNVWAESEVEKGASFFFTLQDEKNEA